MCVVRHRVDSRARFCAACAAPAPFAPGDPSDSLRTALEQALGFQYQIDRLLGRGGMGAVYLARELALDREVAIKVLPPERSADEARARFRREARTAARLSHPNVVPLLTFGEVNGLAYSVLSYVRGESLRRACAALAASPGGCGPILSEVADALDYATGRASSIATSSRTTTHRRRLWPRPAHRFRHCPGAGGSAH